MKHNHRLASLGKRVVAKMIDLAVANVLFFTGLAVPALLSFSSPLWAAAGLVFGAVAAFTYLLFADAWQGRSLGKRLVGLKVVDFQTGAACSPFESFVRNAAGLGLLRIFQVAEESANIEAGNYRGSIVVDLKPDRNPHQVQQPAQPPSQVRIDFDGIAEYARNHRHRSERD